MNCQTFSDRVFDFLQGSLRGERADFDAHRASCAACAARLDGIRENERLLTAARVPMAPPDLWPKIAAAVAQGRPVPFRALRVASFLAAAAALLLAFTLFATGGAAKRQPLKLVVQEVGPESQRAFRSLVPKYDDVDAATAMVDTLMRNDY
jgi:anti-sigma factor RsiW